MVRNKKRIVSTALSRQWQGAFCIYPGRFRFGPETPSARLSGDTGWQRSDDTSMINAMHPKGVRHHRSSALGEPLRGATGATETRVGIEFTGVSAGGSEGKSAAPCSGRGRSAGGHGRLRPVGVRRHRRAWPTRPAAVDRESGISPGSTHTDRRDGPFPRSC